MKPVPSYLVLAYAEDETVAKNVGFYYMANAGGRFVGTILSGAVYQWQGPEACLGRLPTVAEWHSGLPR
ncbi:MAG TPA: hypothetical protein PKD76_05655 [Solirubrobacterales bacterium]|nr:hypothetical protein [Solirubrobacterales bacterium]